MLPVRKSLRLQNKGPQTVVTLEMSPSSAIEPVSNNLEYSILTKQYEMIASEIKQMWPYFRKK